MNIVQLIIASAGLQAHMFWLQILDFRIKELGRRGRYYIETRKKLKSLKLKKKKERTSEKRNKKIYIFAA